MPILLIFFQNPNLRLILGLQTNFKANQIYTACVVQVLKKAFAEMANNLI
jgi:hypothetical protein